MDATAGRAVTPAFTRGFDAIFTQTLAPTSTPTPTSTSTSILSLSLSPALALALALSFVLAACGDPPRISTPEVEPCSGLVVSVVEEAIAPPANVSALISVLDCDDQPLGVRLEADRFELAEEGKVLSTFEATRIIVPADRGTSQKTLIALDLSGSIVRAGLKDTMLDGALVLAKTLAGPKHEVAVFGFDGRPDLVPFARFTKDPLALQSAVESVRTTGLVDDSTNLNGAIKNGLRVLDQAIDAEAQDIYSVAHGALVVFTDGADHAGRVDDTEVNALLDTTPHSTFAIGLGPEIDTAKLSAIGRTRNFLIDNPDEVQKSFEAVAQQVTARAESKYIVSYCSPARAGRRTLRIAVRFGELSGDTSVSFDASGFGSGCKPEDSPLR